MQLTKVRNKFGDEFFEEVNGNVFHNSLAQTYLEKFYIDAFNEETALYILVGSDSLLVLDWLKSKSYQRKPRQYFIVVDFGEVIANSKQMLPKWIMLVSPENLLNVLSEKFQEFVITESVYKISSIALTDKVNNYVILHESVQATLDKCSFDLAKIDQRKIFLDNTISNQWALANSIFELRNTIDRPVLVIASGPSFDNDIEWIIKNQDCFYIFAIGRMAKVLQKYNVKVDVFVTIDPSLHSYENSREILLTEYESLLIFSTHSVPALVSGWRQPKAFIGFTMLDSLIRHDKKHYSCQGPTVSHTAVHAAHLMGATKIYLSGVDLCFNNGKTHNEDSLEANLGKNIFGNVYTVKTYSGKIAETEVRFKESIDSLSSQLKGYKVDNPDLQVFNLNKEAAKIEGISYCTKENISLQPLSKSSFHNNLAKILKTEDKGKAYLLRERKKLVNYRKLLTESQLQIKKLLNAIKQNELNQLEQIQARLKKKLGEGLWGLLIDYGGSEFGILKVPPESISIGKTAVNRIEMLAKGLALTSPKIVQRIDIANKIINVRLLELNPKTNLQELYSLWKETHDIARFLVWRSNHPNIELDLEDKIILDGLYDNFFEDLEKEQENYKDELTNVAQSPQLLIKRLKGSLEKEDLQSLIELKKELTSITSNNSTIYSEMLSFIEAKLLEKEQDFKAAIEKFKKVHMEELSELALKEVLNCYFHLNNQEGIIHTFEKLIPFSYSYLVNYSDFLKIIGQTGLAQQVLGVYLSHKKDDFHAWLKMLELVKINESEQASQQLLDELKLSFGDRVELN